MKIGCVSWSYRREFNSGRYDFFSWLEHCAEDAGLDGVELYNRHFHSTDDAYLAQLLQKANALDLDIYTVDSKCYFDDFSKEKIDECKEVVDEWLGVANKLESPVLRFSIAGEKLQSDEHQNIVFDTIAEVARDNRDLGIEVGIENVEPGLVEDADDVRKMHERSEGILNLILDNGSFQDKSVIYEFMRETLEYAIMVHAKFFGTNEDGSDTLLDYMRIKDILDESDYDDYLSIEFDSDEVATASVPRIADYLRKNVV